MLRLLGAVINFIFKLIALVFAALFIAATVLVLLLYTVNTRVASPDLYTRALADARLYERLPAAVGEIMEGGIGFNPCAENPDQPECKAEGGGAPAESPLSALFRSPSPQLQACMTQALGAEAFDQLARSQRQPKSRDITLIRPCLREFGVPAGLLPEGGAPVYFIMLNGSDYEMIVSSLLPAGALQTMVEDVIGQAFAYLDFKTDTIKISLVALKQRATGDAGINVLLRLLRAQPACTAQQLAQWAGLVGGASLGAMPICRVPDEIITGAAPLIRQGLAQILSTVPDEAVLLSAPQSGNQAGQSAPGATSAPQAEDPRVAIQRARTFISLSPLVPAALLLLVTVFGVRSRKGWLRWWGIPLLLAGLIGVGMALAAAPLADWAYPTYVVAKLPPVVGPGARRMVGDRIRRIAGALAGSLGLSASIVALAGLALVTASSF
ncbi:MAG: hypothetical protein HYR71_10240, partial [Chloroflexi bacterium]|nr:hypothetical protein [Chloroflexota bacterium]